MLSLLSLGAPPTPRRLADDGHELAHGHAKALCACEAAEEDHPFTIDCSAVSVVRDATKTLESSTCDEGRTDTFEWGGSFATPDASYKWVSQAVDGAFADPAMDMVIFAMTATDTQSLFDKRAEANTLLAGTCTVVNAGGSIPAPTAAGACYKLTFPADPGSGADASTLSGSDFIATIAASGVDNMAFFTAHMPTEFERDIHYLMEAVADADLGAAATTPNEPIAQTDQFCKIQAETSGLKTCQQAFFILQAPHDYCTHDTLTRYEEELMHTWESRCLKCAIERGYADGLKDCPNIDCSDASVVDAAYYVVAGDHDKKCTPANFKFEFEWGGVFNTPDNSYKWVAQAVDGAYADPAMKLVLYSSTESGMGSLFMQQEAADTLMATGDCSTVVVNGGTIPKPTTAGVCVTLTFPTNAATDFYATVDTTGVAMTTFFAEHVPIEFERDIHYLMEAVADNKLGDAATVPNEPINQVPAAGGGHAHRRQLTSKSNAKQMSQVAAERAFAKGNRRRTADAGTCCTTAPQQGAWKQIVAYHDLCDHDDVPTYVEVGFHDYEESCEDYFCNAVPAGYDGAVCSTCFMISKEKAGTPIFEKVGPAKASA